MDYPVACECGKNVRARSSDAGWRVTCECGRDVEVPALSILRRQAGQPIDQPTTEPPPVVSENATAPRPPDEVMREVARILAVAKGKPDEHKATVTANMLYGAILFIIGVVVTVCTYAMAAPGGVYLVAFGAILGGAVQFIRGAIERSR